ncbi:ring-cleaving dioxygenase [Lichenihabitans psoromatis]|uniref:ring-cleaving dioxygenase n=1 Tax=Lichenihabitans psoromatis TaxID=2528642 RepID=UPI0010385497|nr:ring-cleaving dioxygenase [Lichenihabitans psoromatis]
MQHGIHHVTAISGPAPRNLKFHVGLLGQRLVKKTVNFDDPGTYHLYYGDAGGTPGSILTFFPWEHAAAGKIGSGETGETAFRVPVAALTHWTDRFAKSGVAVQPIEHRFGEPVLRFVDPDGMRLALVGVTGAEDEPGWTEGDIPADHAIRGFHGVTLLVADVAPTAAVLTDVLGFEASGTEGAVTRFLAPGATQGGVIDLKAVPGMSRGRQGTGSVHHVAFRAADDAAQAEMARKLVEHHGLPTTEQKDRQYFRSVYFREPGGTIFEIATDQPGFAVDEPQDRLGEALKLPAFLEASRSRIEAVLPALT